jgi:hypothetical protein
MIKLCLAAFSLVVNMGCSSDVKDTFNSEELISSKGERVYINTLNWGVTDDYQISAISNNKDKVRERSDTLNVVKGLEPFIYTFRNDTLTLYFDGEVNYKIKGDFETIHVNYIPLNKKAYKEIRTKAYNNEGGYYSVPKGKKTSYPSDMPKPTSG